MKTQSSSITQDATPVTAAALTGGESAGVQESADIMFVSVLLRASARIEHTLNALLVDFGLNLVQYRVLGAIVRGGASTPSKCAKELTITSSHVSRAADLLHSKGLVNRHRNTGDRRVVTLHATALGVELLRHASRMVDARLTEAMSRPDGPRRTELMAELSPLALGGHRSEIEGQFLT